MSPARHSAFWPPSIWFLGLGILANALLTLTGMARASQALWTAIPVVLGSAPNVAAVRAIAFTCLGLALRPELRRHFCWLPDRQLVRAAIIGAVIGLLCWEWLQLGNVRMRFDWTDVWATLFSGLACFPVAGLILRGGMVRQPGRM